MKVISGGQTGVDRAALDAAISNSIEHGGWCPRGRLAENNAVIPDKYHLNETITDQVNERTQLNIRDADATLIILPDKNHIIKDGTQFTMDEIKRQGKCFLMIYLDNNSDNAGAILEWIQNNNINVLNVAGPRESNAPGIYQQSFELLNGVFMQLAAKPCLKK